MSYVKHDAAYGLLSGYRLLLSMLVLVRRIRNVEVVMVLVHVGEVTWR